MSLQRGASVRGWEGVTRNLATSAHERSAWSVSLVSIAITLIVVGVVALILSQSDVATAGKAVLLLGVLVFTKVFISSIYSKTIQREDGSSYGDDLEAGRARGSYQTENLMMDGPAFLGRTGSTAAAAAPASKAVETKAAEVQTAPVPAPQPEPAEAPVDVDAEETEAADPGVRPEGLAAAREGGADDLTQIKGVGPKLAELCNSLGFYHFDQIAAWKDEEVAWVDQNLEGFKGRVTRDNWVDQAKALAGGTVGNG